MTSKIDEEYFPNREVGRTDPPVDHWPQLPAAAQLFMSVSIVTVGFILLNMIATK